MRCHCTHGLQDTQRTRGQLMWSARQSAVASFRMLTPQRMRSHCHWRSMFGPARRARMCGPALTSPQPSCLRLVHTSAKACSCSQWPPSTFHSRTVYTNRSQLPQKSPQRKARTTHSPMMTRNPRCRHCSCRHPGPRSSQRRTVSWLRCHRTRGLRDMQRTDGLPLLTVPLWRTDSLRKH